LVQPEVRLCQKRLPSLLGADRFPPAPPRLRYTLAGFDVEAIAIREDGKAIDRVNM
jgi:hypothetical protein